MKATANSREIRLCRFTHVEENAGRGDLWEKTVSSATIRTVLSPETVVFQRLHSQSCATVLSPADLVQQETQ